MTSRRRRIPRFRTLLEESEYWDRHSITEHLPELKPIKVVFVDSRRGKRKKRSRTRKRKDGRRVSS